MKIKSARKVVYKGKEYIVIDVLYSNVYDENLLATLWLPTTFILNNTKGDN